MQGHTKRAMDTASASDAFNAVEIFALSGAAATQRMNAKGKKITTPQKCPGVIYHRTTKEIGKEFFVMDLWQVVESASHLGERVRTLARCR